MDQFANQTMSMDDSFQVMMQKMKELSATGAPHKLLAKRAGQWTTKSKFWMDEGPATESSGTCSRKMILGDRYLLEEFYGEMMGAPFTGLGITGYDNQKQKYFTIWMDSMSTGVFMFEGDASPDGKTFTFEGEFTCPVKGQVKWNSTTTIKDDNTEIFEMRAASHKSIDKSEIVYTRL